ncbi:MAG TPA: hypothetical protein VFI86_02275 [Burkholderiales bacterium]|nr:hypothetical protein [Burkholderiales bacterium]
MSPAAKAIVYGVLVDVGGSVAAALVIAITYAVALAGSGMPAGEIERTMADGEAPAWLSAIELLTGGTASFLGGFVCARVAREREMQAVGVVAAVSGIVSLLMGRGAYAFEWSALLALASMAAVFAGGWTGTRKERRGDERSD